MQTAVLEAEAALGVVEGRIGQILLLEARHPGPLPHGQAFDDVLQRLGPGLSEVPDDLLLRDAGAVIRRGGAVVVM
ncbi:hypothetical protein [Nonomuraea sp. NPDC049784]|uniref:hypothetical protein n=1 Tax=Nonomuraea sp. NPDC049784 TaxID=3154361 RepID=UPI0033CDBD07